MKYMNLKNSKGAVRVNKKNHQSVPTNYKISMPTETSMLVNKKKSQNSMKSGLSKMTKMYAKRWKERQI